MIPKQKPELLSPAGAPECVNAAVQNGCTAIYVGAGPFNARKNARNFSYEELEAAVDFCHLRGVKLYVTANTLIKNSEITPFLRFIERVYQMGVDGVILQDIGMAALVKENFPDFYLLGSTQMTIHNQLGVDYLQALGFGRVILSRELSLAEIKEIAAKSALDIECFIHGALCVCYSGQCLMSAFNGGRSGNRGLCAQPCRLPYQLIEQKDSGSELLYEGNILSPRDMMGLEAIPGLIDSGVRSFKIEGRMKGPEYVAGVTAIYRKYIDRYCENPADYTVAPEDARQLAQIFNRSGQHEGYFSDYAGRSMITEDKVGNTGVPIGTAKQNKNGLLAFKTTADLSPGDGVALYSGDAGEACGGYITKVYKTGQTAEVKINGRLAPAVGGSTIYRTFDKSLNDTLRHSYAKDLLKSEITGTLTARKGERLRLAVTHTGTGASVCVEGVVPEAATGAPLSAEKLREQVEKTGATPFRFTMLEITADEEIFMPIRAVNELRRLALEELKNEIIINSKKKEELSSDRFVLLDESGSTGGNTGGNSKEEKAYVLRIKTTAQLRMVAQSNGSFSRVVIEASAVDIALIEALRTRGTEVFFAFPAITRQQEEARYAAGLLQHFDGILARGYSQIQLARSLGLKFSVDYTLGVYNDATYQFLKAQGAVAVCVSPELSLDEIRALRGRYELVAYGSLPLMVTAQCPIGNFVGSRKDGSRHCSLKDSSRQFIIRQGNKQYKLSPFCDSCTCNILCQPEIDLSNNQEKEDIDSISGNVIACDNDVVVDDKYIMSTNNAIIKNEMTKKSEIAYAGQYLNGVK